MTNRADSDSSTSPDSSGIKLSDQFRALIDQHLKTIKILHDLCKPSDPRDFQINSQVCLRVGETRLFADRNILIDNSRFFSALFRMNPDLPEYELKEIDLEDVQCALNLIYNRHRISEQDPPTQRMLDIADYFDIPHMKLLSDLIEISPKADGIQTKFAERLERLDEVKAPAAELKNKGYLKFRF